jgi:hypothetical protein
MAKAPDPKEKTLTAAARLMRRQGYHGTALHDILAAGGSPEGRTDLSVSASGDPPPEQGGGQGDQRQGDGMNGRWRYPVQGQHGHIEQWQGGGYGHQHGERQP